MIGRDGELGTMQDQIAHSRRESRQQLFGVYRGKVAKLGDRADGHQGRLGQLQIVVPEVWGKNATDVPWADPVMPFAGDGYGFLMLPKVDDGVYVMFEGGNQDRPLWLGGFRSENAKLPEPAAVEVRVIVTPHGHKLLLDDKDDKIELSHKSGSRIIVDDDKITLEVKGGGTITIDKSGVAINGTALKVDK